MSPRRVANKIVLVTGAGKGIGAAAARLLAKEGASVYVSDIDDPSGTQVTNDINNTGGKAQYINLNTASEAEWKSVLAQVEEKHGRLDVLVNNAGILLLGGVEEISFDQWRRVQSINADGVFLGVKYAVQLMNRCQVRNGSIINLCSIEGLIGDPRLAAYNASKGAVKLLTKSVALDQAKKGTGIRVNSVCPAYIETPLLQVIADDEHKALKDLHPIGRLGEPEEVANVILFLASDESSFMTGTEVVVDGGYTAQ